MMHALRGESIRGTSIQAAQTGTLSPFVISHDPAATPGAITPQQRLEGIRYTPLLGQEMFHEQSLVREASQIWAAHRAFRSVGSGSAATALSSNSDINEARRALWAPIGARLATALVHARDEIFEYDTRSQLAQTLSEVIGDYGSIAVSAIGEVLSAPMMTDETAAETLRHLGAMNDDRTSIDRIRVLARELRSASPRRRYAAAVGLADMNAPNAIEILREAAINEPIEDLRRRFQRFVALLSP
jgi:hypothetical protein